VIWIDCNPQAGGEMRDMHPMLVLSPGAFNARTGLVIGLPMTTAAYNATNPFALAVGAAGGRKTAKTSYVPSAQVVRLARTPRQAASAGLIGRRRLCDGLRGAQPDHQH
jgi:mRNA interferase MazF